MTSFILILFLIYKFTSSLRCLKSLLKGHVTVYQYENENLQVACEININFQLFFGCLRRHSSNTLITYIEICIIYSILHIYFGSISFMRKIVKSSAYISMGGVRSSWIRIPNNETGIARDTFMNNLQKKKKCVSS